jgi:hypothetical protein
MLFNAINWYDWRIMAHCCHAPWHQAIPVHSYIRALNNSPVFSGSEMRKFDSYATIEELLKPIKNHY